MSKKSRPLLFVCGAGLAAAFPFSVWAQGEKVTFAIGEWEPYTGEKMEKKGFVTEIVEAACKEAKLVPSYTFSPWKRAESDVESGKAFATFPYTDSDDRKEKFIFSDILISSQDTLLYLKKSKKTDGFTYTSPASIKGFQVGIIAGSDYSNLEKEGAVLQPAATGEQNVLKLLEQRVDFFADDKLVIFQYMKKALKKEQIQDFAFVENFGTVYDYRIMASKKYKDSDKLISKFNEGLAKIRKNGTYAKISSKYILIEKK